MSGHHPVHASTRGFLPFDSYGSVQEEPLDLASSSSLAVENHSIDCHPHTNVHHQSHTLMNAPHSSSNCVYFVLPRPLWLIDQKKPGGSLSGLLCYDTIAEELR